MLASYDLNHLFDLFRVLPCQIFLFGRVVLEVVQVGHLPDFLHRPD